MMLLVLFAGWNCSETKPKQNRHFKQQEHKIRKIVDDDKSLQFCRILSFFICPFQIIDLNQECGA